MAEKELSYDSYKNILNRVAYKLVKSKKTYKHSDKYTINKKEKTYSQIINTIKKNGTNYKNDEYVSRFIEDVIIKNNNTSFLPDYVIESGNVNKYNKVSYVDMAKRVVKWRKANGRNPKNVKGVYTKITNNCTNPYTSSPHYTDSGCNKLGQCTSYYCGPHSIHQGFRKFGIKNISEAKFASWAGTTSSGTDHEGLNTAIKKGAKESGFNVDIKWYNFSDLGKNTEERFKNLAKMICQKNTFGFCHIGYQCNGNCSSGTVFGHYEMLDKIDIKGKKVRALNSLGNKCNSPAYCGHLQWRSYALQAHFIANISQKSICIVTKK